MGTGEGGSCTPVLQAPLGPLWKEGAGDFLGGWGWEQHTVPLYLGEVTWLLRVGDWFPVQVSPGNPYPLSLLLLPRGSVVPALETPSSHLLS